VAGPTASNPTVWLKADSGVYTDAGSTLATNGQTVEQWNDQSGNGNNVSQATSGNRPTFETGLWGSANMPGVLFASASSNYMDSPTFGTPLSQPTTIFIVVQQTIIGGATKTFFDTNTGANEQVLLCNSSSGYTQYAGTNVSSATGLAFDTPGFFECYFDGGSSYTNRNGVQVISGNVGSLTLPQLRLGSNPSGTSGLDGYILEVLVYSGTIGSTETAQILSYLKGRWLGNVPASGYVLSDFPSNTIQSLEILTSSDGVNWTGQMASYFPGDGYVVRDPSITLLSGTFWVCHTVSGVSADNTTFGVASSPDGVNWTFVTGVDCSAVTGGSGVAWAPEWFLDASAPQGVRVIVTASATRDVSMQLYETHPTNSAFTTWSALVEITGTSLPSSMIDPYMLKIGSTYYLWYKNETTTFIEVLSSASLTSGYTQLYSGNWAGWGDGVEGPSIFRVGNTWHAFMDQYVAGTGLGYSTQASGTGDWTGTNANAWSALTDVNTSTGWTTRHGTVLPLSSAALHFLGLLGAGA
jgi:hypothetical protein